MRVPDFFKAYYLRPAKSPYACNMCLVERNDPMRKKCNLVPNAQANYGDTLVNNRLSVHMDKESVTVKDAARLHGNLTGHGPTQDRGDWRRGHLNGGPAPFSLSN